MLSLCSVTARLMQPCVATTVSYTIRQRRKSCLPPVPPLCPATLDMTFRLWKPLAAPPPFLCPPADRTSITVSALRETCPESHADREGGKNERRKIKMIVGFRDRLPSDSSSSPILCRQPAELDFYHQSVQLSSFTLTSVNTRLPYHFPLHPVTMTTSQLPSSALRCVPLTDSCFTFPLVLLKFSRKHTLSVQDPSALPGGGPTYPPSFRTTTSTWCCWRRPGCALLVTRPRSAGGVRCKSRGHRLRLKGFS